VPPLQAHLARAQENVALYMNHKAILPPTWQATVLFYAAVHYVEALCDALGHGGTVVHSERDAYIRKTHRDLWKPYSRLKQESVKARYLTNSTGGDWTKGSFSLTPDQVHDRLYIHGLQEVIAYVEQAAPLLRTLAVKQPAKLPITAGGSKNP